MHDKAAYGRPLSRTLGRVAPIVAPAGREVHSSHMLEPPSGREAGGCRLSCWSPLGRGLGGAVH